MRRLIEIRIEVRRPTFYRSTKTTLIGIVGLWEFQRVNGSGLGSHKLVDGLNLRRVDESTLHAHRLTAA